MPLSVASIQHTIRRLYTRRVLAFVLAFMTGVAGTLFWLHHDMQAFLNRPMSIDEPARLEVRAGTGFSRITDDLVSKGWISHPYYLILEARQRSLAHRIKAGEYAIPPGTSPRALLELLVSGRVIQYPLTLPEGRNFREIITLVRNSPHLQQTLPDVEVDALIPYLDFLEGRAPEGMFYPDTYHFPAGTTDLEFLRRAWRMMQDVLAEEWQARAVGLPYADPYEALIMASIIEKETGDPAERDRIAGVFVRRLQRGMKLQADPTVIYALGREFDGNIRRRDLSLDSPWNTYMYAGLPPTPIASPGRAAIHAALQPAEGDELYFVARGDGTHEFSATLDQHNAAVRRYQLNRTGNPGP